MGGGEDGILIPFILNFLNILNYTLRPTNLPASEKKIFSSYRQTPVCFIWASSDGIA